MYDYMIMDINTDIHCSDCGTVGMAVASPFRGHRFETNHQQVILSNYLVLTFGKTKITSRKLAY